MLPMLTNEEIAELRRGLQHARSGADWTANDVLPRLLDEAEVNRAAVDALDALVREVTRSGRAGEIYLGAKLGDARRVLIRLGRSIE